MGEEEDHRIPRVLVVLGNFALNGQERGNIEVFYAAKEVGVDSLFVTHREWGHVHLQPTLDRLGLQWTPLGFARHFTKRLSPMGWIRNLGRLFASAWGFGRLLRRYRPTHVHVANPHYVLSVLPALLLSRTPVVYRLGDVPTQHHLLYRLLWRWFIVPRTRIFVCISEFVRQSALATGVPRHKTKVIYSYPPERPPDGAVPSAEPPPFEGRTVVYVGQVAQHKGVHFLVQTAITLCQARADVRFFIAGALHRKDPFALALVARVQAGGLSDRIRFLGYLEDVPGLLAGADLHVCPSVCEEALGNVVLEAKQAGVPSVVFPSGGLPELIEHDVDGWVCDDASAADLEATLHRVLSVGERELDAAKAAARSSLERMGITKQGFSRAWGEVYGIGISSERREQSVATEAVSA